MCIWLLFVYGIACTYLKVLSVVTEAVKTNICASIKCYLLPPNKNMQKMLLGACVVC